MTHVFSSLSGSLLAVVYLNLRHEDLERHPVVLGGAATAGALASFARSIKYDREYLRKLGRVFGGKENLLAEIYLERKKGESVARHFDRISNYLDRLLGENEVHEFCVKALEKQLAEKALKK